MKDPKILRWLCLVCGVVLIYQGIDAISSGRVGELNAGSGAWMLFGPIWLISGLGCLVIAWKVHRRAGGTPSGKATIVK